MDASQESRILSFLKSLTYHGLLAALLYWIIFLHNEDEGSHHSEPIQIESINEKNPTPKAAKKQPKTEQQHSPNAHTPRHISLSDLGMRLNTDPIPETEAQDESRPASNSVPDDDWDMLNPDPRVARFNQYIYHTVQGWLDRDAYMNTKQIYGTIKLKIWFTKDGEWLESETNLDGIDEDFKQIVLRALRKSFAVPIPHPYLYQKEKFFLLRTVVVRH